MNTAEYIRTLLDFLYWSNGFLFDAAEGISDEEYSRDNGFAYKSIRGILTHALDAEVVFMSRLTGVPDPGLDTSESITEENLPTFDLLRKRWAAEERTARDYLQALTPEGFEASVTFTRRDGSQATVPSWHLLSVVYQHTLQHRSEAAEALSLIGRSPGSLDFSRYLNR